MIWNGGKAESNSKMDGNGGQPVTTYQTNGVLVPGASKTTASTRSRQLASQQLSTQISIHPIFPSLSIYNRTPAEPSRFASTAVTVSILRCTSYVV